MLSSIWTATACLLRSQRQGLRRLYPSCRQRADPAYVCGARCFTSSRVAFTSARETRSSGKKLTTRVLPNRAGFHVLRRKADAANTVLNPKSGEYVLSWQERPKNVLLISKPGIETVQTSLLQIARYLIKQHNANVIVEQHVHDALAINGGSSFPLYSFEEQDSGSGELERTVDLVVTLGGDGTFLHVSSLFDGPCPPVVPFSMGTLGFLMEFDINTFQESLTKAIENDVMVIMRVRLACEPKLKEGKKNPLQTGLLAMNDITLHRGRQPHLTMTDILVDGDLLTHCLADGLVAATPTGSTAYSLSAGGPIVHPSVEGTLITPICPRSLSFRPAILPADSTLTLRVSEKSRGCAEVSIDGRDAFLLEHGESIEIKTSRYPVPTVNRLQEGSDWATGLRELLKWNINFSDRR